MRKNTRQTSHLTTAMICAAALLVITACDNSERVTDAGPLNDAGVQVDSAASADAGLPDASEAPDSGGDVDDAAANQSDSATIADAAFNGDADPGIDFIEVPAGTYQIGSPDDELGRDRPIDDMYLHNVTLSHAFRIGVSEVSQRQYERVTGDNPSYTDPDHPLCADCPVDQVMWNQAAAFTNELSRRAGLSACYSCTGSGDDISCAGIGSPYDCPGYRLPTEAEWEIAARAGVSAAFPNGGNVVEGTEPLENGPITLDNGETVGSMGWYMNNSGDHTHPVAQLAANDWGLYDVVGNLDEWTHDWHRDYDASEGDMVDPYGPDSGETRVCRGGSFNARYNYQRLAYRNWYEPDMLWWVVGLRVAQTVMP